MTALVNCLQINFYICMQRICDGQCKMSAKIFLPEELFYIKENCNLYGEIKISDDNAVSYFVVAGLPAKCTTTTDEDFAEDEHICDHLRYLGHIRNLKHNNARHEVERDVALSFVYDNETPNIYSPKLSVKSDSISTPNIFLYDADRVLQLQVCPEDMLANDDMHLLYRLVESSANKFENAARYRKKYIPVVQLLWYLLMLPLELMTRVFAFLMETTFAKRTMKKMVFYEHYKEWKMYQISR